MADAPNYRQDVAQGWQRAREVRVNNPYNGIPTLTFSEEAILKIDDLAIYTHDAGELSTQMTDPTKSFQLRNPTTGEIIGTATYMDVYVMLHSLYYALALERDAQAQS